MVLTAAEVCRHLLQKGLLEHGDLLDEGFALAEANRRNSNLKIFRSAAPSYVVKQGANQETRQTLAHEAAVYQMLGSSTQGAASWPLPRCYDFDPSVGLLVIEMQRGVHDLAEHSLRVARFGRSIASEIGRAVRTIHLTPEPFAAARRAGFALGTHPPWALQIHRPGPDDYVRLSGGSLAVVRVIQEAQDLCCELDDLRSEWSAEHLIHCDLKWENCLVTAPRRDRRRDVYLIDWEFARLGDPAWDVGSMFANYLSWWLRSFPALQAELRPEDLERATVPMERMQPAAGAFWAAYRQGLAGSEARRLLVRSVRSAGARLVQTAFEHSQDTPRLTRHAVALLQLAQSVLTRPLEAAVQLLALPLGSLA